jgi:ABC-2 type transport system permease protein
MALLCLLLVAAVTMVLGWLWIGILRRALVTVDTSTQSSAVRQAALPFARFGLRGTMAARYWIYQRREPSSLIYWGIVAVVMIAASVSSLTTPAYRGALLTSAGIGAALLAIFHSNSAGMTGPAFILEAMAMTSRRALRCYFAGQDLALSMIAVPLLTVISFGLAAVAGHPAAGFLAVAVDFAGIGASMALSNIFTARLPYPTEKREGSPVRGAAGGHASYALGATLGSLAGTAVAVSPVAAAEALTSADPAAVRIPVLLLCAACYGIALAWAGVRIAARVAEPKLPELCQIALHSMA